VNEMLGGYLPERSGRRRGLTAARGKTGGSSTSLGGLVDVDLSEISREQSPEEPVARVRAWLGSAQFAHSEPSLAISRDAAHSSSTGSLPLLLGDAGAKSGEDCIYSVRMTWARPTRL